MMNFGRAWLRQRSEKGDTIVEVIIVTAILGLVLVGSYSLSSHALRNGIDANKRTEAVSYAQQQIEYIKDAYFNQATGQLAKYKPPAAPAHFCITNPQGTPPVKDVTDPLCKDYNNGSGVTMDVSFDSGGAPSVFTVSASWTGSSGQNNVVNLYYRVP